jgi:pyridoxamine 5'-phosphate oxidase family protein
MFTEKAIAYINSQKLLRIASVSTSNQPDNSVTNFAFDGKVFYLSGSGGVRKSRRGKNVLNGNTKVALIIDDREDFDDEGFSLRYVRVYGTVEIVEGEGYEGYNEYMRVTPTISWSWGIEEPVTTRNKDQPSPIKTIHG